MSVTLRQKPIKGGKEQSLYLDFYPAIKNPQTGKLTRREFLSIYIQSKPVTSAEKELVKEKKAKAEAMKGLRELQIINEKYDFIDKTRFKMCFLDYFYDLAKVKGDKWIMVYFHFDKFTNGKCSFGDLTSDLCHKFREYLINANQLKNKDSKLSQNSASAYFRTFRAVLKKAYQDRYLRENINDFLESIKETDVKKEYLTLAEIKIMAESQCEFPVLKSAALFSCLTGLRISDVISLEWEHITPSPLNGFCIRKRIQKSKREETIPISTETLALCGERETGIVFKGLKRTMINAPLKKWLKEIGITKHITFHCFRNTNATLLAALGVDILTIRSMLAHKNVKTTQLYANPSDEKKIEAANAITLN
jgi:integrase